MKSFKTDGGILGEEAMLRLGSTWRYNEANVHRGSVAKILMGDYGIKTDKGRYRLYKRLSQHPQQKVRQGD